MLYVLVNNDYQIIALRRYDIEALAEHTGTALITIPHSLSSSLDTSAFKTVYQFDTPIGRWRLPLALWHYGVQARAITRKLDPCPGDTLLFFTEVEWLNHVVAQHFRTRGARVILVEDCGFGTYVPMSLPESELLSKRERCIELAFRLLPKLRHSRLFKVNGVLFPRLPDQTIDAIGLYRNVPIYRRVPVCVLRAPALKKCNTQVGTVIFLNEPLYDYYQTNDAYLAGLQKLMTALVRGFEKVYFKFHPRETDEWKTRIGNLLRLEFPTIAVINRSGPIEQMILDYLPAVLASYFSAALLSMEYDDIEPMYLYHLVDDLKCQPTFEIVTRVLQSWGYKFVRDDTIHSGYQSGIIPEKTEAAVELRQLLSLI